MESVLFEIRHFRMRAAEVGSENLGNFINFVPLGEKGVRPAAFIISDGKLPAVPATINAEFKAVMALGANTYQSVIDTYDLQRGDQLTFVAIEESTVNLGQYVVKYARVILDPRNADGHIVLFPQVPHPRKPGLHFCRSGFDYFF
jgi:hypothetical protein